MSNLISAKDALSAELVHARQGIEFYNARIVALEEALATLESIDDGGQQQQSRRAPKESGKAKPASRGRRQARNAAGTTTRAKSLPATGKEFWVNLVASEPKSSKQILEAAVEALGISPGKDDMKKLSQRQANALHMLVKDGSISDSGAGRERKFYRAH